MNAKNLITLCVVAALSLLGAPAGGEPPPENPPEISSLDAPTGGESQSENPPAEDSADTAEAEANVIASVDFNNIQVTEIFQMISDLTGWSIITSPGVATNPPNVSLWVREMPAVDVLDQAVRLAGLVAHREGNTVHVMTFDEYTKAYGVEKRVIQLRHARSDRVVDMIKKFVDPTQESRSVVNDTDSNKIILLLPPEQLRSMERLVEAIDVPFEKDVVRLVRLQHRDAQIVAEALKKFLANTLPDRGEALPRVDVPDNAVRAGAAYNVVLLVESALNVIVLRGAAVDIARVEEIIASLDAPSDTYTVSYELYYTSAADLLEPLEYLLNIESKSDKSAGPPSGGSRIKLAASAQNNRILAEATGEDHKRIAWMISTIDKPLAPGSGGMRVHRLENASANEVAAVINSLLQISSSQLAGSKTSTPFTSTGGGINRVTASLSLTQPPSVEGETPSVTPASTGEGQPSSSADLLPVQVTPAPEINAVIIRASAAQQEEFAQLISELDRPRDQVLLEVTLITVYSDHTFDLGVELGGAGFSSGTQQVGFTSFGVGSVTSATGQLKIKTIPPFGANYAVFHSNDFSVVINALKSVGDVRISAAPRVLVEDNAKAVISQVNQEPFEVLSVVDQTVVSSFGGFVDAGTVLNVTPHISRKGWLRLSYEVDQSTFGTRTAQQLAANLPPPRRQSRTQGAVRIPSDHVVVLGGMVSSRLSDTRQGIPGLMEIPLIGQAFSSMSNKKNNETLYIFIKPIVLSDPYFKDLLDISSDQLKQARLKQMDYPSNPMRLFETVPPESQEVQQ